MVRLEGIDYPYIVCYKSIRRIYIRYQAPCFLVSAPYRTPHRTILHLSQLHEQRLVKLVNTRKQGLTNGSVIPILGVSYSIEFGEKPLLDGAQFIVQKDHALEQVLELAKPLLWEHMNQRVLYYHRKMHPDKNLPEILLKKVKGYYGRYHAKKHQVTFNQQLVFFDLDLIDYVVVHELAHLSALHHQPGFYRVVENILPDYRQLHRRLKKEGILQ